MPDDIAVRNAAVVAAVKSWNRIQEKKRRLLMLYRESKDGELIVDVLEFHVAFEKQEANGKVYGWLVVWGPEIEADEYSSGARHLSWTREMQIPLAHVVHKKLLPPLWPGFDGFAVNSSDPVMRDMQDDYEREVREGLALAEKMGFSSGATKRTIEDLPEWQRRLMAFCVLGTVALLVGSCVLSSGR